MTIQTIGALKPDKNNARRHSPRNLSMIETSLQADGFGRSILLDAEGNILAGNGVTEAAAGILDDVIIVPSDGTKIIAVQRTDVQPGSERAVRLAIADNRASDLSDFDPAVVAALADEVDLSDFWREDELDALLASIADADTEPQGDGGGATVARQTLAERFLIPPFSVLDARQGYWQSRKRAWLALGIQSELGRGDGVTCAPSDAITEPGLNHYRNANAAPGGSLRDAMTLGEDGKTVRGDGKGRQVKNGLLGESEQARSHYARTFGQDLMRGEHVVGAEGAGGKGNLTWVKGDRDPAAMDETSRKNLAGGRRAASLPAKQDGELLIDHDSGRSGSDSDATSQSGTSIFDPVLCEIAYRWFSPPGGAVLDPFAGGSVRGIVAAVLGRGYTGIDLSASQIAANEAQAAAITPDAPPRWIVGDSGDVGALAPAEYDFILSCPPYADLERYSDDPRDLSTMAYADFLAQYRAIVAAAVGMLRDDRFAAFVVGDIRDPKGMYRNFVSDTIAAFHDAGMRLYNEAILVTAVGSLPIRVGRQFEAGRKLGKTHQNVLVFIKGDAKRATEACGHIEVYVPEEASDDPAAAFGEVMA